MTVIYMHVRFEDYKAIEQQCKDFAKLETMHNTADAPAYYHKAFRLKVSDHLVIEFHGPAVRGADRDMRNSER